MSSLKPLDLMFFAMESANGPARPRVLICTFSPKDRLSSPL